MAGVSEATVSRVLNNSAGVSADKRDRVLTAAKTLRFRPNSQARLLAGGKTDTILLVHPMIDTPLTWYFHQLEAGAARGCAAHGFSLKTHFVFPDTAAHVAKVLKPVESGEYAGVILAAPFSDDANLIAALRARHFPFVLVAAGAATRALASGIGMDDERAGYELTDYLLTLGHRRFGFSLGLKDHLSAEERFDGARRAIQAHGGETDIVTARGALNFQGGHDAFHEMARAGALPTALICANDESAAGAIHAAHEAGLSLPGDVSIVGFDDAPFAALLSPPLTTISQGIEAMGARAIDRLADTIEGRDRAYEMTRPRLVIRQSVRDLSGAGGLT